MWSPELDIVQKRKKENTPRESRKKRESGIAIRERKVRKPSKNIQKVRHRDDSQTDNKDKELDMQQIKGQGRGSGQDRSGVLQLV